MKLKFIVIFNLEELIMNRKKIFENIAKIDEKVANRICQHLSNEFPSGWCVNKCEVLESYPSTYIHFWIENDFGVEFFVSFYEHKKTPYRNAKLHCKIQDGKMNRRLPKYNPHYLGRFVVKAN